jgi:hypothetical protein
MQALVHHRPGSPSWEDLRGPALDQDGDVVAVARRPERHVSWRRTQT